MKKKKDRLQTEHLTLKCFDESDRISMVDILCNEEIKKTYMIPDFADKRQAEALFEKLMEFSRSEEHFEYGIYYEDALIGFVNDCEIKDATIEIGYVIAPEYQGKGFATEAVRCCVDELFRMGFVHIVAGYFEENKASARVMEKCGMHKLDAEDDIEYQGVVHHCLYYGIDCEKEYDKGA